MSSRADWPFLGRSQPFEVSRAAGAYLFRPDGSPVLDAAGGAIVANVGHGRKDVAEAIAQAAMTMGYVVPTWLTPQRQDLVNELREHWLPAHLDRIHLTSGGSEANESAMKIAVQFHAARGKPEKHQILGRSLSYHGTTITTAGVSGHAARKRGLEGILNSHPAIETPFPLHCPLGPFHPDATDYYIRNLEFVIQSVGADNIAALIAEPLNGSSGGAITPPPGYWAKAQAVLRKNDILLIMDEVMTGFGRTGRRFGSELYDIQPDLLVAGKGMAGGYAAISGCYATEDIAATIADSPFEVMFHTFGALPVSCAAAVKVLQILREEDLLAAAANRGNQLKARLMADLGQHPNVAEVRGEGMLIAIEVVKDREQLIAFPEAENMTGRIISHALENGVFFYPGGTGEVRDIICIGAPFIIGDAEIDKIAITLGNAINSCCQ